MESVGVKVVVSSQVVMLVLAWKLDAQSMGYFTLQEWLRGMGSLQYVADLLLLSLRSFQYESSPLCFLFKPDV